MRVVKLVTVGTLAAFVAVSSYGLVARGVLESPSVDVDHFEAGAGDQLLIVRAVLAVLAATTLALWAIPRQPLAGRVTKLILVPAVFLLFWFSALGIQRFSPNYSEQDFRNLVERHNAGTSINASDLLSVVGEPLAKETIAGGKGEREAWLYSYMPSSGFGWEKRVAYVDATGRIVGFNTTTEP